MKRPLILPLARTATLFIDLQEEHRRDRRFLCEGFDAIVANAALLQKAARANGVALAHCAYVVDAASATTRAFHPVMANGKSVFSDKDDPLTAICPEVAPLDGEPLHFKSQASAFGNGPLAARLQASGVEWLVVCGVWTEACVATSVRDALDLGLRVLLVKDACGSGTEAMHQTAVLNLANRLYGGAVADTAAACRLLSGETVDAWMVDGAVPFRFTLENVAALYDQL